MFSFVTNLGRRTPYPNTSSWKAINKKLKLHRGTNDKNLHVLIGSQHIGGFAICTPM